MLTLVVKHSSWRHLSVIAVLLTSGCSAYRQAATQSDASGQALPQLVRFFNVSKVYLNNGTLVVAGKGSAAADNGKHPFTAKSSLSSYPFIQMTITNADASVVDACYQTLKAMRNGRDTVDIRGSGRFTMKSLIDPPLETGLFTLTTLGACGNPDAAKTPTASSQTPAVAESTSIVSAANLVAVPERYLDQETAISGALKSPVHFTDSVSDFVIESERQTLSAYFVTTSLSADARLLLVHASPGDGLILSGKWTRINPKSLAAQAGPTVDTSKGYEFDVSNVISVAPASSKK